MAIEPLPALHLMDDDCLPFGPGDTTAGSETELQAVVVGSAEDVDLPLTIAQSKYFANLVKRLQSQDMPKKAHRDLRKFLADNSDGVWDNSWVRFPLEVLSPPTRELLEHDLLADKTDPAAGPRGDVERFLIEQPNGRWSEQHLRIPISYLLKLSLAEAIHAQPDLPPPLVTTARGIMRRFQNDNISPETLSFYIAAADEQESVGHALAKETSLRFLLTQLLTMWANQRFGLKKLGQEAIVYFSPHTPIGQNQLNEIVSDSFYSELTTSPCLSGWDRGEEKYEYMKLCHQVLSRSRLHAMAKVRDAGLVCNNLVVLPNFSSASLANNGIHVSLGSRRLGELLQDPNSGFAAREEKSVGDLAIKIVEHFLPLFVGTYSAAPYRIGFADFHAERVLGFLPHELDYTHLRMLWRRWKKRRPTRSSASR